MDYFQSLDTNKSVFYFQSFLKIIFFALDYFQSDHTFKKLYGLFLVSHSIFMDHCEKYTTVSISLHSMVTIMMQYVLHSSLLPTSSRIILHRPYSRDQDW